MGRSSGFLVPADGDSSQRGMRTRSTSSRKCATTGKTVMYHCNYCNKDITGKIRIKCAQCPDFDLCVECFSVGVEVAPHESDHPYRVMDNLSFPLLSPDWNADEEILLLEGIEMYGLENWAEVAEHVGTKSCAECILHYRSAYLESSQFPLPDMTSVTGKNKSELLAMAKEQDKSKKVAEMSLDMALMKSALDAMQVQGNQVTPSGGEGLLSGYNPKRDEFEPEYDPNAEQSIADMEFKDSDTKIDRELKLQMLQIYNRRLDERERRKKFILERNLLEVNPFYKDLSLEEWAIYDRYSVFQRFKSKEDHGDLMKTVIEEHRMRKRIEELEEAKHAGCRTSAQADRYFEIKRRRLEAEQNAFRARESANVGPSRVPTEGPTSTSSSDVWDITGLPGIDLLSDNEKQLCCEMKILPSQYMKMQEEMSVLILRGQINRKSDAHPFFRTDPDIVDRVYDVLVTKGIAHR